MEVPFDQVPNMQRLRYEAFSKFATEINRCDNFDAVATLVAGHVKFIIDSFIFRAYFQFDDTQIGFTVFRGSCSIQINIQDPMYEFEQDTLLREIPLIFLAGEIAAHPHLKNTIYNHPKVFSISVLPVINSGYSIVITNALRNENESVEADFKFLRLITDLVGNKFYQLALLQALEKKGHELEQKNDEVTDLNHTLEERVIERTLELDLANRELQTLFYNATHDLRTPLTNIMGLASLASMYTKDRDILSLFDGCLSAVSSLDKLLRKLNSLSCAGFDGDFEMLYFPDIVSIIKEKLTEETPSINLSGLYDQPFISNKNMMLTIFENIIENACVFCDSPPVININFTGSAGMLEIHFCDNGIGMPPAISSKAFDMFYRGSELSQGSGLGLYVVKKLLHKLGGHITLESRPGSGTTFKVELPYLAPQKAHNEQNQSLGLAVLASQ